MAPIPDEADEDMRETGREREALTGARPPDCSPGVGSLLIRHGISRFKPRLKTAARQLAELR
jgi:hypothetical protein